MDTTRAVRTLALVTIALVAVGSFGPWQTSFLVDRNGIEGDGVVTLILAVLAGVVVFTRPPGSRWLMLAGLLGIACAFVGISDLIQVLGKTQYIGGREVKLVSAGWGLWLTAVAASVFSFCAVALWVDEGSGSNQDVRVAGDS